MKVFFHPLEEAGKQPLLYAVIFSFYQGKMLLVRHKERTSWEFPGGHIEKNESPLEAASRELQEETGALKFDIKPYKIYSVKDGSKETFGGFFIARIQELGSLDMEIEEIKTFDKLPEDLTYPSIIEQVYTHLRQENLLNEDALNRLP